MAMKARSPSWPISRCADAGMVQRRGGLGFPLKTAERAGIPGDLIRQKLQGHEAVQAKVFGLIHHAHATAAQLTQDAVVGDRLVDH